MTFSRRTPSVQHFYAALNHALCASPFQIDRFQCVLGVRGYALGALRVRKRSLNDPWKIPQMPQPRRASAERKRQVECAPCWVMPPVLGVR